MHSVSISMPPSPVEAHIQNIKRVLFRDDDTVLGHDIPNSSATCKNIGAQTKQTKFHSQPIPKGSALHEAISSGTSANRPPSNPRIDKLRDKRYDSFKTWSGKLERQISNLRGRNRENEQDAQAHQPAEMRTLPVDRYFDALEGPELDVLRVCIF